MRKRKFSVPERKNVSLEEAACTPRNAAVSGTVGEHQLGGASEHYGKAAWLLVLCESFSLVLLLETPARKTNKIASPSLMVFNYFGLEDQTQIKGKTGPTGPTDILCPELPVTWFKGSDSCRNIQQYSIIFSSCLVFMCNFCTPPKIPQKPVVLTFLADLMSSTHHFPHRLLTSRKGPWAVRDGDVLSKWTVTSRNPTCERPDSRKTMSLMQIYRHGLGLLSS